MGKNNDTNPEKSSPILHFPVENQPPRLSIHIDDAETGAFYVEYYAMVYKRCLFVLHNEEDAHDIAHDVFAKMQKFASEGGARRSIPQNIPFHDGAQYEHKL